MSVNDVSGNTGKDNYQNRVYFYEINQYESSYADSDAAAQFGEIFAVHQQEGGRTDKSDHYRAQSGKNAFDGNAVLVLLYEAACVEHQ